MKTHNIIAYGTVSTICECSIGEGLPMHDHPNGSVHTHTVIRGRTRVTIGAESSERTVADGTMEFPKIIKHEIIAVENDTIFVNVIEFDAALLPKDPPPPPPYVEVRAGVRLASGEIV